jgi:hypothetical protein
MMIKWGVEYDRIPETVILELLFVSLEVKSFWICPNIVDNCF